MWGLTGSGWASLLLNAANTTEGFLSHRAEARAASARARLQASMADRNAQLDEMQREDVLNRGALEENRMRGETSQAVSSDRASLAAQGIDVSTGSAAAVTASQQLVGDMDALQIRDNAARQAWGFDVEAANQRLQGRLAILSGENEADAQNTAAFSTLLGGIAGTYQLAHQLRVPKLNAKTLTTGAPAQMRSGEPGSWRSGPNYG